MSIKIDAIINGTITHISLMNVLYAPVLGYNLFFENKTTTASNIYIGSHDHIEFHSPNRAIILMEYHNGNLKFIDSVTVYPDLALTTEHNYLL